MSSKGAETERWERIEIRLRLHVCGRLLECNRLQITSYLVKNVTSNVTILITSSK